MTLLTISDKTIKGFYIVALVPVTQVRHIRRHVPPMNNLLALLRCFYIPCTENGCPEFPISCSLKSLTIDREATNPTDFCMLTLADLIQKMQVVPTNPAFFQRTITSNFRGECELCHVTSTSEGYLTSA